MRHASVHPRTLGYLGRARFSPYTASKGGMLTLTRSLAREFAPTVRVNAVAPGPVETELLRGEIRTPEDEAAERQIPMRRFGEFEDLDGPLLLLASDASSYMNGSIITVDGGWMGR